MGRARAPCRRQRRGTVRVRRAHLQEPDGGCQAHYRRALVGPTVLRADLPTRRSGTMNDATQIATSKPRKRCAVYCRVSSDERLGQEFNSIDAQKEAGHAYVASQRSEGWIPVADDYD